MSDWQQPPGQQPPPSFPPPGQQPPPSYSPPAAYGPPEMPPQMAPPSPGEPPKRKTGTIVTIVVVVVVLLLCCCVSVAGYLIYTASRTASTISELAKNAVTTDPMEVARLAKWEVAKGQFSQTGYTSVAPDARQQKLADAATKLLFPDFTLDELEIGPGSYDAKTKYYTFDTYVVLMHLTADPTVKVARSYSITQAAADHLTRGEVTVKANRALEKVGGTSWLLYATDKVQPLVKGIKDQKYVALMKKVAADWPGGCIVMLQPDAAGKVTVRVFTWESYWKSPAEDYMEATYTESGGVWTIGTYDLFLKGQVVPSTDASGV
jgi:hypothetical protein